ncbi:MAG: hypothetical protein DRP88_01020 [Candidatus Neomarinimicrobiota bacterium]|nr:MAG: hypothetical protein DRP88_01020 [Candidatus Neomarinimicrobiota bacterium]
MKFFIEAKEMDGVKHDIFYNIARLMLEDVSWEELFESIFNILRDSIPYTSGTLFIYDEGKDRLEAKYTRGDEVVDLAEDFDFGKGKGVAGWVASCKRPVVLPSLKRARAGKEGKFLSFLSIPLWIEGRLIGVINLAHQEANVYRPDFIRDYEALGSYITVLIEKLRMKNEFLKQNKMLREALDKLKKMQDRLVEKERMAAIGEIVVTVNHEINNPLTSIIGIAEILDYSLPSLSHEKIRDSIKAILNEAKRIKRVTHRLARLKSSETGSYLGSIKMIKLPKD